MGILELVVRKARASVTHLEAVLVLIEEIEALDPVAWGNNISINKAVEEQITKLNALIEANS